MQLFYFVLKTGRQIIPDPDGQELHDTAAARRHAGTVAQQLMKNREVNTRGWRIQVCDDYLRPLFNVFFVEVDETLLHCPQHLQAAVEDVARMSAALDEAVTSMRNTLTAVRETLSQADRILGSIPGHRA